MTENIRDERVYVICSKQHNCMDLCLYLELIQNWVLFSVVRDFSLRLVWVEQNVLWGTTFKCFCPTRLYYTDTHPNPAVGLLLSVCSLYLT